MGPVAFFADNARICTWLVKDEHTSSYDFLALFSHAAKGLETRSSIGVDLS
jgi:hypothetical protein